MRSFSFAFHSFLLKSMTMKVRTACCQYLNRTLLFNVILILNYPNNFIPKLFISSIRF